MLRWAALAALVVLAAGCSTIPTRTPIPSLATGTTVDGYLLRAGGDGPRPAVVLLHGCGGLFSVSTGQMSARETDWARRFVAMGYTVLMIDSFSPRGITHMCAPALFKQDIFLQRPKDAYGALRYLQAQPYVRPDRVAMMGWSQGGGVTLLSVREDSLGRPPELPHGDFRAAVAFYPSVCRTSAHRLPWTSVIPTLVLIGELDNWTPAGPCREFADAVATRGSPMQIRVYPGAYHDFDWPDMPLRELPAYRTTAGVVPMVGMDPAARADALTRVAQFLKARLEN